MIGGINESGWHARAVTGTCLASVNEFRPATARYAVGDRQQVGWRATVRVAQRCRMARVYRSGCAAQESVVPEHIREPVLILQSDGAVAVAGQGSGLVDRRGVRAAARVELPFVGLAGAVAKDHRRWADRGIRVVQVAVWVEPQPPAIGQRLHAGREGLHRQRLGRVDARTVGAQLHHCRATVLVVLDRDRHRLPGREGYRGTAYVRCSLVNPVVEHLGAADPHS